MPYELCRHIKTNGKRCHSPCVNDLFWCYFHARLHFRHRAVRSAKPANAASPLLLPVLEDRESVQVAASLVVTALAAGHLDDKRAALLIRALQLASRNLTGLPDLNLLRTGREFLRPHPRRPRNRPSQHERRLRTTPIRAPRPPGRLR